MNIKQARMIPLSKVIEYLGGRFSRNVNHETWYFSPFRSDEKTASFKLNDKRNTWYDFGHSGLNCNGGDIIALWCEYHGLNKVTGVKEALAAIRQLGFSMDTYSPDIPTSVSKKDALAPRWKIIKTHKSIFYPQLKEELHRREISMKTAGKYLTQVFIQDNLHSEKKLNGLGFANDHGGVEFSIPNLSSGKSFKSSTTPKGITTFKGSDEERASLFEGFWDFLSWIEFNKFDKLPHHCIVLNSNSFIREATAYIISLGSVKFASLYLDNDESGFQATNKICLLLEPANIIGADKRASFEPHKDLNEFWINKNLGRRPLTAKLEI